MEQLLETNTGIHLIVGLNNPGPRYTPTRHNVGAWFVEQLLTQHQTTLCLETKFKGMYGEINDENIKCKILLPTTYMNDSGQAVLATANFYKILPENILVIHDELDFPPGTIRLKKDGGHGGHNGLQSIINYLNSKEFYRLRIGIGHPGHKDKVINYVLNKPSIAEKNLISQAIETGLTIIPHLLTGNIMTAINLLHGSDHGL